MRTPMSEIIDLAFTQSIERYLEMEPETVYDAIVEEWPEQTAVILIEFLFKRTCNRCDGISDFVQVSRVGGNTTYIVPLCSCDWADA